jgi:hypothetical protein
MDFHFHQWRDPKFAGISDLMINQDISSSKKY